MLKRLFYYILFSAVLLASCGKSPDPTRSQPPLVSARVATVTMTDWPVTFGAVGAVHARTEAVIAAKVMAYVKEVAVHQGDQVTAGQVLVKVDARDLDTAVKGAEAALAEAKAGIAEADNAVAAAQAGLTLAEVTFQRMKGLKEKNSISKQEFDEAEARLKMAQAGHAMALAKRSQLNAKIRQAEEGVSAALVMRSYAFITAPFAGIITARSVDPGALASPGLPLLTLEQKGTHRLEVAVEEKWLPRLKTGQPVVVILDSLGLNLPAKVSEIVPRVDAAVHSFTVKIDLPVQDVIRSGVFGRAIFEVGHRQTMGVPAAAVVEHGQLQSVYVLEDGSARLRLVTLGERRGELREVLSGLTAGEQVLAPVPAGVADGAKVEVLQ